MKIGIVTTWFERGAAYVSKQYEQLLQDEHEVFIYARGGEEYAIGDPEWDKENVWWGKRVYSPISTYIDKKDFVQWLTKNKIELVIFNEQRWWDPIFICKQKKIKTVAYIDYYTEETIPFFQLYDALICNTKRHYEVFSWHKQCYYIPWGTDVALFKPLENNFHIDEIVFFHSCGMSPKRKGTNYVIKSFYTLSKKYDNIKLIIHSQLELKKILSKLQKEIIELEKLNKLKVVSETIKAPGLYYKGDVYVYPTLLEGIGLTIAEAISSGLPAIVPNNAPMNEFVKDNISGKLIKIKRLYARADGYYWPQNLIDEDDLLINMEFFIKNKTKIKKYKKLAREYAINNLDWNKNKKLLNKCLLEIDFIDKNKDIESNIKAYFNKQFLYIYNIHFIYKVGYFIYKKFYRK